jgi:hypothetical protein
MKYMKKTCLLITCLITMSVVAFAQAQSQHPMEKTSSTKSQSQLPVNEKAGSVQTDPVIDKAETKETEAEKPHSGKPGNHPHNNGANAHGMEMKEKQQAKQKEKKEEHVKKKTKQEEEKAEKKEGKKD